MKGLLLLLAINAAILAFIFFIRRNSLPLVSYDNPNFANLSYDSPKFPNASFVMEIHDVFIIKNVGIAVTGYVQNGIVYEKSNVTIVNPEGNVLYHSIVSWLESLNQPKITSATTGDNVSLMFEDANVKNYVDRGCYIIIE